MESCNLQHAPLGCFQDNNIGFPISSSRQTCTTLNYIIDEFRGPARIQNESSVICGTGGFLIDENDCLQATNDLNSILREFLNGGFVNCEKTTPTSSATTTGTTTPTTTLTSTTSSTQTSSPSTTPTSSASITPSTTVTKTDSTTATSTASSTNTRTESTSPTISPTTSQTTTPSTTTSTTETTSGTSSVTTSITSTPSSTGTSTPTTTISTTQYASSLTCTQNYGLVFHASDNCKSDVHVINRYLNTLWPLLCI
eukprot:m.349305 g.349305  ORF g.349305 m.349305 type:complete len:255 (-) comp41812_c0_seq1:559-1323(-)